MEHESLTTNIIPNATIEYRGHNYNPVPYLYILLPTASGDFVGDAIPLNVGRMHSLETLCAMMRQRYIIADLKRDV
jgi:hypothetical protein